MARNLSNAAASLLPYSTIEAAASGNVDAINAVLKHNPVLLHSDSG